MRFHADMPEGVSDAAQELRDRIDIYFSYIERFCTFQSNKLFKKEEITSFLRYHIDLMNDQKPHSKGYHEKLFEYLILYDFDRAVAFLESYPQSPLVKRAIRQARERRRSMAHNAELLNAPSQ